MSEVAARTMGWMCSLPSRGTPSSSEITATGNGTASSAMTSPPPCAASRSRIGSNSARNWGRSSSTRRGVNARLTSERMRVWSGGFRNNMVEVLRLPSRSARPNDDGTSMSSSARPSLGWRNASMQSS